MSGHETIRVLEVGVDAQLPAEEESKGLESVAADGSQSGGPAEARGPAGEAGSCDPDHSAEATGYSLNCYWAQVALGSYPSALVASGHRFPGIPCPRIVSGIVFPCGLTQVQVQPREDLRSTPD